MLSHGALLEFVDLKALEKEHPLLQRLLLLQQQNNPLRKGCDRQKSWSKVQAQDEKLQYADYKRPDCE